MGLKVQGEKLFWSPGILGATRYVSLHTADPASGNELSGDGYSRTAIAFADFTVNATNGTASNTSAITLATPTATWDDVTHVAIWDAATNGNMLWSSGTIPDIEPAEDGATVRIPANAMTLSVTTD